jgi:hypothetical protein
MVTARIPNQTSFLRVSAPLREPAPASKRMVRAQAEGCFRARG